MLSTTAAESGSSKLERWLARIAAGRDQAAFAELYAATKGKLFAVVLLIVRRRDHAEEIIQDAYVRIWSNANSYRPSLGSPMTWMISIARNLAIDHARKTGREPSADESVLLALPSECPTAIEMIEAMEDDCAAIAQQQRVLSALQALNPLRRDLIVAAYIRGESRAQLSKKVGVPINTVKTWIRRALLEVEAILRNTEDNTEMASRKAASRVPVQQERPMAAPVSNVIAIIHRMAISRQDLPQALRENGGAAESEIALASR
jgi:RNA polymerase sigma-70 factor, ECF subfamily